MSNELLQIAGYISGYKSLVNCTRINIDTQENINPFQLAGILNLKDKFLWINFKYSEKNEKINEEDLKDLPDLQIDIKDDKSPSKRLRDRMFVFYKKTFGTNLNFEIWYSNELNKIGQKYLDCLEK